MSWQWSHNEEAYDIARNNLELSPKKTIQEIWSQIKTHQYLVKQENLN